MARGTQKVRWIFSNASQPIVLKGISAFTRSQWKTVDVRIEPARRGPARKAEIEIYNGIILNPAQKSALSLRVGRLEPALVESALQRCPTVQG